MSDTATTRPCPCCAGDTEGDWDDLCERCAVAAVSGVQDHGCDRAGEQDACPHPRRGEPEVSEYGERTPTYAGRTAGCVTMLIGDSLHLSCREADIRADERRRVAEEIARAIEADTDPPGVILMEQPRDIVGAGYRRRAAAIARQYTTEGSTDG